MCIIGYNIRAVHKVRHAIFGQFLPPSPCHTLSHIRGPPSPESKSHISEPHPRFLVGLVQKTRTKAPCTNSLSIVRRGFCPGVLSGVVFVCLLFCQNTFVTTES